MASFFGSESPALTVLVVDDNDANRALAKNTLEDEGYTVLLAHSGASGIAMFSAERPHCVLLDVRMADLDGFAVCEQIRQLPDGAHTPILFLTALRDVDTFDRALRAGADDFISKPVRPTELLVRVQSALKLSQASATVREQYQVLKEQRDALLRLQLQKERLMAFVVHDLKNPVNTIDLHAQLLSTAPNASIVRESGLQIQGEARRLMRMILDMLDLSKADEGRLAPQKVDLDLERLVLEVAGELTLAARKRTVEIVCATTSVRARLDPDLIRRMLTNLLENAIRFSPKGSVVRVVLQTADAQVLELRVVDAGVGIPASLQERVFDPFVQLESNDPFVGQGRGLGLSFCKVAIEAHGGTIWVEDNAPGAAFCVRIPHGN